MRIPISGEEKKPAPPFGLFSAISNKAEGPSSPAPPRDTAALSHAIGHRLHSLRTRGRSWPHFVTRATPLLWTRPRPRLDVDLWSHCAQSRHRRKPRRWRLGDVESYDGTLSQFNTVYYILFAESPIGTRLYREPHPYACRILIVLIVCYHVAGCCMFIREGAKFGVPNIQIKLCFFDIIFKTQKRAHVYQVHFQDLPADPLYWFKRT